MTYKQILTNSFSDKIGNNGLEKAMLPAYTDKIIDLIDPLAKEKLRLFDFSDIEKKSSEIKAISKKISDNYQNLYILGTGGATLCGQTLCGLLENSPQKSRLHFMDNIDPKTFEVIAKHINLNQAFILVVSKSGGTLETLTQFAFFVKLFEEKLGERRLKEHFLVITDNESPDNKIRNIAQKLSIPVLPHEKVGGRFSIFSAVGLLPASFSGLDISEILRGAANEVEKTFIQKNSNSIIGAALNIAFVDQKKINATVMMPYVDRLKNFTTWFAQIWAESLGKNDIAPTPIRSLGTLDQHSQLQLYLGGKKDKFYNVIYIVNNRSDFKIQLNHAFEEENLGYIAGKKFSDVINSAAKATIETLAKNSNPVRSFEIEQLDEFTFGQITMNFILETVLIAKYWGLNPFDQPAVEQSKKLTIEMLKSL
jgi:glucose-6-phosphate isomerase